MTKSIDEMSTKELRKALAEREEKEAEPEEEDDLEERFAKIEAAYFAACDAAEAELKEARKLQQEAQRLEMEAQNIVKTVAEKHKVPIRWTGGCGYVPKSAKDWLTEENEDIYDDIRDLLANDGGYHSPGWWKPSYC